MLVGVGAPAVGWGTVPPVPGGPLAGLRVIDLTDDSGRFATKLLAECGASVVRVGDGTSGPTMAAPAADAVGGLLDWWYDGGKDRAEVDLGTEAGRDGYARLAHRADLIIDTERPGRLASLGLDHPDLVPANPRLVQVSLTPFGRSGPRADWETSDLVAAAMGGVLSVCGLPDDPVVPWGRQAFNVGSFYAAICGLAGVRSARISGRGQHIDLSLHEAVTTTVEHLFFQHWFDDLLPYPKVPPRQGSLHWTGAYEVVPARSGALMVTLTPNFGGVFSWLIEAGFEDVEALLELPPDQLVQSIPQIMKVTAAFARQEDAGTLWTDAQARRLAWAEVQSVAQVAANPQHAFRSAFRRVQWEGPEVALPGPVARFHATPAPPPLAPRPIPAPIQAITDGWDATPTGESTAAEAIAKPLEGLRVLDLTHVLAGPHATRVLGDLGADILKLQTADRATSVNDPAFPYFYVWNRSKRAISLDMRHPRAGGIVRALIERCDVLMENFSAGVLDRWGLSYDQVHAWNPRLVYVTMSGCGHEGPWSDLLTYAPTIHALCGITYLSNPPGRRDVGPGFSLNDHAAGLSAAVAVLAALHAREATGEGQHVDISQLETGAYLVGPALLDYLGNGREAQPAGNADPFGELVPNECFRANDGRWLAITCRNDDEWSRLLAVSGIEADAALGSVAERRRRIGDVNALVAEWTRSMSADAAQHLLQHHGLPAGVVQHAGQLMDDPQHAARHLWHTRDHPVFGTRPFDRFPAVWSGTSLEPYLPPPAYVGEHNFEVYPELAGVDEEEIAAGMADGLFS